MNYKAIIDAGFNSFRLSVYTIFPNRSFRLTASLKDYVRLGLGVSEGKGIPEENVKRATLTLSKFKKFLDEKGINDYRVFGTSAFRFSSNGGEVAKKLSSVIGREIEVLSGEEEGRISALAVINSLPVTDGIMFDLGGGSLEVVYFRDRRIKEVYQFPLGGLRLYDKPPEEIRKESRILLSSLPAEKGVLVGSGGNLRAIAKMDLKLEGASLNQIHGYKVPFSRIDKYAKLLPSMSYEKRAELPGISKDRALTIHSAVIVIRELMEILGKDEIIVSSFGLREGGVMDKEIEELDKLRKFWFEGFAYFFNVDPPIKMFEEVLSETKDFYVSVSSYLIQVIKGAGFLDPYSSCYKILRGLTLPGFTADEINLISTLCASAKKYKKKYYNKVKKMIDKDIFISKSRIIKDISESYELGVRK